MDGIATIMYRYTLVKFPLSDKEIDWKNVNLKKMRVKELKKILNDWEEGCDGCLEKTDYIKRIESLKHKHVEL